MLRLAFDEAEGVRQNWVGPEHYLLAVLAGRGPAVEAMAALGITHEVLAARLAAMKSVNGRRGYYRKSRWTSPNPAAYRVNGWAHGYAAAAGRPRPTPEDWLLAVVYQEDSMAASVLNELGVSAAAVVQELRRRGAVTPGFEPPEARPWRGVREVEVARVNWQAVVDLLSQRHPPGSEWQWGFNSRRDRPGKVQFAAEEGIDLEGIVAEAINGVTPAHRRRRGAARGVTPA